MINLKIFKILFDMTRIGWIIVGILVYFLLGWILKDIVFSIITIEGDTTMGDILKYVMRAHKKNGIQDYEKAQEYLTYLIKYMKREQGGLE